MNSKVHNPQIFTNYYFATSHPSIYAPKFISKTPVTAWNSKRMNYKLIIIKQSKTTNNELLNSSTNYQR